MVRTRSRPGYAFRTRFFPVDEVVFIVRTTFQVACVNTLAISVIMVPRVVLRVVTVILL